MATPSTQPKAEPAPAPERRSLPSTLAEPKQRFLSQVLGHSLSIGRRTAKDFLRHFPPKAIMLALKDQPELRSAIVVPATGIHGKVAQKKSPESLAEDIQIALDEGVTDESAIVALFDPDDRVRFLDHKKLWEFVAEGEFWKPSAGTDATVAKQHVAFILECARGNGLLTELDLVEGCTLDMLLGRLPKGTLEKMVKAALLGGRQGKPFDDEKVLEVAPPSVLVEHLPLSQLWDAVVVTKILVPAGYQAPPANGEGKRSSVAPPPGPAAPTAKETEVVVEVTDASEPEPEEATVVTLSPRMRPIRVRDDGKPDSAAGSTKGKH